MKFGGMVSTALTRPASSAEAAAAASRRRTSTSFGQPRDVVVDRQPPLAHHHRPAGGVQVHHGHVGAALVALQRQGHQQGHQEREGHEDQQHGRGAGEQPHVLAQQERRRPHGASVSSGATSRMKASSAASASVPGPMPWALTISSDVPVNSSRPPGEHQHPVAVAHRLVHRLGREQQRHALLGPQLVEPAPQPQALVRAEGGGRLVEQQDAGPARQGDGEVEALERAGGELAGGPVGHRGEVGAGDEVLGEGGGVGGALQPGEEAQVLARRLRRW